ncbi:hypothetical protein [Agrobacterium tumefaciens]|uniref:hypothetical protein n=1 Tax=Agrobacterium tumefaciens TaxID=358 RepID=UPI000EF22C60|nr:hypothetical protein [Agrobacterium tumefaciens]AYM04333.1 hypothetical protein At1D1460_00900 [Agrobacterium tumefaciens]NSZ31192.1 hypothetical protein [Agrobacterium tumefaciens]QLG20885.1 hypothetical protein EML4_00455 [Agrobacterium tumefaciens]UXS84779.1 hypothetical protein FY144_00455 [Agrobacterium tumefaciens]
MAFDYLKLLAKLDRPPSGPNWVRFVQDDVARTTKSIVSFVKGSPRFTYLSGYTAIKDRIQLGINLETALAAASRSGAPAGRKQNEDLVRSFFEHDEKRRYATHNFVEFDKEWFRVSRDVAVPVSPLSVIREQGKFVPLFVCGWSELNLTDFQRRLLVTICEDAFLSLTDYQNSPAEFLFFPKGDNGTELKREAEVWQRGDYDLLSDHDLNAAVEIFLQSRELARQILLREMAEDAERRRREGPSVPMPRPRDLFDE